MNFPMPETKTAIERAALMQYAGLVSRCHLMPEGEGYLIGQHSWNMQVLYLAYCSQPEVEVMAAMALHDVPELWTGDIPSPVKSAHASIRIALRGIEQDVLRSLHLLDYHEGNLSEHSQFWLKACDICDLYLWSKRKRANGNLVWDEFAENCLSVMSEAQGVLLIDRPVSAPAELLTMYDEVINFDFQDLKIWTKRKRP